MTFAKAFQKAFAEQGQTIELPESDAMTIDPEEIPMMYRAQIAGRCSLQYAGSRQDRDRWTQEWLDPRSGENQPRHQHSTQISPVLESGQFYRVAIAFPWRVFTNCGQDSIARPILDCRGIPRIPGSSIKGLFRRACQRRDLQKPPLERVTHRYCGDKENLRPGILRFHGAYPIGDWAGTVETGGSQPSYRLVDIVHPQQDWQVGTLDIVHPQQNRKVGTLDIAHPQQNRKVGKRSAKKNANALISLYQPTLMFEISSSQSLDEGEWEIVGAILRTALRPGLGGKTSSGYGLVYQPKDRYSLSVDLTGKGLKPVLLGKEPEFRPNLFKATLRGHLRRLLAGFFSDKQVDNRVGQLFGSTQAPARVDLYWQERESSSASSLTYNVRGTLWLDAPEEKERKLLESLAKFAYTMGGFGKSWRRVWHEAFYQPIYRDRHHQPYEKEIGCHWESDEDWLADVMTPAQLATFLDGLEEACRAFCGSQPSRSPVDWRETWHRDRVAVYTAVTESSRAIDLFHQETFKTTPAIGGKSPTDERPVAVSSVWHRMLPISASQYLEIVTVFHGSEDSQWRRDWERNGVTQLQNFVSSLEKRGLQRIWGSRPRS